MVTYGPVSKACASRISSAGTTETRESEAGEEGMQAPGRRRWDPGLEGGPQAAGRGNDAPQADGGGRAGRGLTRMMRTFGMRISLSSLSSEL